MRGDHMSGMGTRWSQEGPPEEQQSAEWSRWWAVARRLLLAVLLLGLLLGSSVLLIYILLSCIPRPCKMPVCRRLLDHYLASGNTSVAPCSDFFSFACGKVAGTSSSVQALAEDNESQLRRILEAPGSWHLESGEEKAFQFYNSCIDTDAIEAAGAGPLRQVIEELGGWPLSGNWTPADFNQTLRLLMSEYGQFPFFRAYLGPHPTAPHTPIIQIDQPEFDIPRKQEEERIYAQILREYVNYLSQLGTLLEGDPGKVQEHAYLSLSITSQLLQSLRPPGERQARGELFQILTIGQLQEMAPAIDWLSCLQATFTPISLSPSQSVVVHDLAYLKDMSQLLENQMYSNFLQSHMVFGLVATLSPALDSEFQKARRSLLQKLQELTERPPVPARPRWMTCVEETRAFFEPTLAALFSREVFSPSTQSAAMDLFTAIKDALITRLRKLPWMDEETRKKAQDRVAQLQVKMGAPAWPLEPGLTGQKYSDVHLGPSFLQSFLSGIRSRHARSVQSSLEPPPDHRWQASPWGIQAYYSVSDHMVIFPARLLQPPFFHPAYPRAVNFGAAGSIMARELLHVFHQLLSPGGCPACDARALKGALLCLEHQYAAFPRHGGTPVSASHAVLEDAADVGALAIALQAYHEGLLWHHGETTLPKLGLTPNQLFFRSYAQVMCRGLSTEDSQVTHSPPTLRVHGPLTNTPAFARYFGCPHGALLNASRHCQLW